MQYIDVEWHHQFHDEPIRLVSEIDCSRFEVRKLEYFRDGRVAYAPNAYAGSAMLGEDAVPPLAEINSDPQFVAVEITGEQFEALWLSAVDAP